MKKFLFSLFLFGSFAAFVFYQRIGGFMFEDDDDFVSPPSSAQVPASAVATSTLKEKSAPMPAPMRKKGQFVDGTFTGSVEDAYYGNVQVRIAVTNGKISDVVFLDYPQSRPYSVQLNEYAMPILKSEAIQAQSANVDIVSGATATSGAFKASLTTALAKAKRSL